MKVRQLRADYSQLLTGVSIPARYVYLCLQPLVDDDGRIVCEYRRLWSRIFPTGELGTETELIEWLNELDNADLIEIYEIDQVRYLEVADFKIYQRPNRTSKSRLPASPKSTRAPLPVAPLEDGRAWAIK